MNPPLDRKLLVLGAAVLLGATLLALVACQGRWLRETRLVRSLFYPPQVERGPGIGEDTEGASFDHGPYAEVLARHVDADGRVDYGALLEDPAPLDRYLDSLAEVDLEALARHARIAVELDAYNAFTLRLMLDHPGVGSIQDIPSGDRWKAERWELGGETVSLDQLEHERLRPRYGDPRFHFALVCAAHSCPRLRDEPYRGEGLGEQLDDQARHFFRQERHLRWDEASSTLHLSEILDWFRGDFADSERGLVERILPWVPEEIAGSIRTAMADDRLTVRYIPYDWSLNGTW